MEKNGIASRSERTKHIKAQYLSIKYQIDQDDVEV